VTHGVALVRRPGHRLAEGLVTHIERSAVDVGLAGRQHEAYLAALSGSGWRVREVEPAEDCPDSVFVEDAVVVCGQLAVLTRPGAPQRRPELAGVERAVRELGLRVARIEAPGTLDGGDVLQVGTTVYVGQGGRTDADGLRQLGELLAPEGRAVVGVPLGRVLHLKSAVTALPDGTVLMFPGLLEAAAFPGEALGVLGYAKNRLRLRSPGVRAVPEESGCHVVPLGGDRVLLAASAPRTAGLLRDLGLVPVVVDIGEFERLEGCVTCLSVLVPHSNFPASSQAHARPATP
jgi:dimethylargininase